VTDDGLVALPELVLPARTALLVQEVQRGVVGDESSFPELVEAVIATSLVDQVARLADAARAAGVRVVHCTAENMSGGFGANRNARLFAGARLAGADNAPGTTSVQPVPELGVAPGDVVLPRYHGLSPMTGGPLDSLLRNDGITTVVVVGVSLNIAIPNLVFDAVNRSYQVVVPVDAVAGVPVGYGDEVVRNSLALVATLATSAEVAAAWASGHRRVI
jgi:nicotinamidase-related amidase